MKTSAATPLAYSLADAAEAVSMNVDALRKAIDAGHLRAKRSSYKVVAGERVGAGKILVPAAALQDWVDGLVDA